jgi:hypothetical protein
VTLADVQDLETTENVARKLKITGEAVRDLGRRGLLTPVRVGRLLRWRLDEVAALAAGKTAGATT